MGPAIRGFDQPTGRGVRSVWWLWPTAPLVLLVGPSLLATNAIDDDRFERAWRTPKGLDGYTTTVLMVIVAAFVVGTVLAALLEANRATRPSVWPDPTPSSTRILQRIYPWLIGATVFGYAVWIGLGLSRGLSLADVRAVLATQDNFMLPIKAKLDTLAGVTTFTQVAIPAAIVGVLLNAQEPRASIRWGYRLLILLAAARAFMLAERLAVAEIVVPIMVVKAAHLSRRLEGRRRLAVTLAPVFGVLLLVAGFAASEYTRSWNWYSRNTDADFVDFVSERLVGYYATSHNNGALLLNHGESQGSVPYFTTTFVWQIPPGSQLGGDLADDVSDDRRRVLHEFANPEFNSPNGLASVVVDYGLVGGTIFALLSGLAIGGLHLSFLHGRILGLLLYPMVYTGLLELPRYLYWFQGRATPAILVAVAVTIAASQSDHVRRAGDRRGSIDAALLGSLR
ncbi:MAG: oligosaccharide repeat unit polymerase [Acidimicrobiia bacterium]|nr:oligosaccharide repeat unit polymerase [Acidimicrobiia bacterium]